MLTIAFQAFRLVVAIIADITISDDAIGHAADSFARLRADSRWLFRGKYLLYACLHFSPLGRRQPPPYAARFFGRAADECRAPRSRWRWRFRAARRFDAIDARYATMHMLPLCLRAACSLAAKMLIEAREMGARVRGVAAEYGSDD